MELGAIGIRDGQSSRVSGGINGALTSFFLSKPKIQSPKD